MRHTPIKTNFIYPEILPTQYFFGGGEIESEPLRPDGDWRDFLPPNELQNVRGIESSACYIEAQQACISTLEEEQFDEKDNNYSARFNALLSNGTEHGGDPLRGADSIKHDGLIKDSSMPFGDNIQSWEDFHSWKGVAEKVLRKEGKQYLAGKVPSYDMVFSKNESVENKYKKLREALKYCPCPISVSAWYEENGLYVKPQGATDNHLVELVYIDSFGYPYIRDTYAPFLKKLDKFYNFDFAMRWVVTKKTEQEQIGLSVWETLMREGLFAFFTKFWIEYFAKPVAPQIVETPTPVLPKLTVKLTNREKIHEEAKAWIGLDASVKDLASDEVGCAESTSNIISNVIPQFPSAVLSTSSLTTILDSSKYFKRTILMKAGNVIISPRTPTTYGHAGFFTDNEKIISNDSATGLMKVNYNWNSWIKEFKDKRKLKILIWEAIE